MYSFVIRSARRKRRLKLAVYNLSLYGAAHAAVDAACAALVLSHLANGRSEIGYFALLVMLYNALAFGLQPLIGLISDRFRLSYETAIAGCIFTAFSTLFFAQPLLSVVIAGFGNAMFHVGGGIMSLNLYRGKAAAPGIFVAPGALGLMIGTLIGRSGGFTAWPFALILLGFTIGIMFVKQPNIEYSGPVVGGIEKYQLIILLFLGSISIRALIGFVVKYSWKSNIYLLVFLTLAIVLGKGLGGIAADRFGWHRLTVAGLLLSAPLLAFGTHPMAGILGMFLFNLTMPVTLTAVANLLPELPGFAFGLSTLALVTGVFIMYLPFSAILSNSWVILCIICGSAALLNKALRLYSGEHLISGSKKINENIKGE